MTYFIELTEDLRACRPAWRSRHPGVPGTGHPMTALPLPVQILAACIGTWMARHQERTIEYLREENRVLREKVGGRIRLTAPERRRLARSGTNSGARDCVASPASPAQTPSSAGTASSSPRNTTVVRGAVGRGGENWIHASLDAPETQSVEQHHRW